ncbi:MAG: right-handed parallel beta-helix repeat-containing protein [Gemmatimonadetes bacterium]|nr:right-handed parallel beta-helix repeat-containing protein [Gemmatimonadota bacterium]
MTAPAMSADIYIHRNPAGEAAATSATGGRVVAGGADASAVIQQAVDSLPAEGGRITIAAGTWDLTSTVTVEDRHGVHLQGAARGIRGGGGTVLRSDRAIDLLDISGNRIKAAGVTVSDLHLVGSGKENGRAGILVRGATDLLSLHNVGANHCGIGFHLRGGGGERGPVVDAAQIQFCDPQVNGVGLKIERGHYVKVVGGEFSDCGDCGILLSSPESGYERNQGIRIVGVTGVRNGRAGIRVGRNTEDTTVTGGSDFGGTRGGSGVVVDGEGGGRDPANTIVSGVHAYNNREAGILVRSAEQVVIQGCICSVHDHVKVDDAGQRYGIRVEAGARNVLVQGNLAYGNREQGVSDATGEAMVAGNCDS